MTRGERSYGFVLVLVLASSVVQLAVSGSDGARLVIVALQAATLVAAVRTTEAARGPARLSALVATAVVIASVVLWVIRGDFPVAPAAVVNGLLVAVAPLVIAKGLLTELQVRRTVSLHTLSGVLAIYLLAGMFFSFIYGVIGVVDGDALFVGRSGSNAAEELYFSFVTLSTVGYGDLSPAAQLPRALAVAEMLIGQIYLVTVVALIVSNLGGMRTARE